MTASKEAELTARNEVDIEPAADSDLPPAETENGIAKSTGPGELTPEKRPDIIFDGRFGDTIHGSVHYTREERAVFANRFFKRLQMIKQLGFNVSSFPAASHTRYEHSLGVMHLADRVLMSIVDNQRSLLCEPKSDTGTVDPRLAETSDLLDYLEKNLPYFRRITRLAALLHDVGHGPFSHACEKLMPTWSQMRSILKRHMDGEHVAGVSTTSQPLFVTKDNVGPVYAFLESVCNKLEKKEQGLSSRKACRHEVFTLMMVCEILSSESGFDASLRDDVLCILSGETVPHPDTPLGSEKGILLLELLRSVVSGEIDADRMDYLLRDARRSVVPYGEFNLDGVLSGMVFFKDPSDGFAKPAVMRSAVADVEHFLMARWSMYLQVYHHPASHAADAMVQSIVDSLSSDERGHGWRLSFPVRTEAFRDFVDSDLFDFMRKCGKEARISSKDSYYKTVNDLERFNLWQLAAEENSLETGQKETGMSLDEVRQSLSRAGVTHGSIDSKVILTSFSADRRKRASAGLWVVSRYAPVLPGSLSSGEISLRPFFDHAKVVLKAEREMRIERVFCDASNSSSTQKKNGEE